MSLSNASRSPLRAWALLSLLSLTAASAGCGPEHEHEHEEKHGHGEGCETRANPYTDGEQRTTQGGAFRVTIHSQPAPPIKGDNVVTLTLVEAATSNPVASATVKVEPWMPDHGHGSERVPVVTEQEPGRYRVENLNLSMLGLWELRTTVQTQAVTDKVTFSACIQ